MTILLCYGSIEGTGKMLFSPRKEVYRSLGFGVCVLQFVLWKKRIAHTKYARCIQYLQVATVLCFLCREYAEVSHTLLQRAPVSQKPLKGHKASCFLVFSFTFPLSLSQ